MGTNVTIISGAFPFRYHFRNYTWATMASDMPVLSLGMVTDLDKLAYSNAAGTIRKLMVDGSGGSAMAQGLIPFADASGDMTSDAGLSFATGTGLTLSPIDNAVSDTDKFLVSDGGVVKYRTGAEVLSDIGGVASSHTHAGTDITGMTNNKLVVGGSSGEIESALGLTWDGSLFTVSGGVSVVGMAQTHKIDTTGAYIRLRGQSSGSATGLYLFAQDGDKSDNVIYGVYARGTEQGSAPRNALYWGWIAGDSQYQIWTDAYGSGSVAYPIVLQVDGASAPNTNQQVWATDGTVGIGMAPTNAKLDINGSIYLATIAAATTDTDKFLVSDSGVVKYRTGAEVLSDIGGLSSSGLTDGYLPNYDSGTGALENSPVYTDGSSIEISTGDLDFGSSGIGVVWSSAGASIKNPSSGDMLFAGATKWEFDNAIQADGQLAVNHRHVYGNKTAIGDGGLVGSPTTQAVTGGTYYTVSPATSEYYQLTSPTDGQVVYVANINASNLAYLDGVGGWTLLYPDEVAHGFYNSSIGDWVWSVLN